MYRRQSLFPSHLFLLGPQTKRPQLSPPFPNVPQSVPLAKFGSHVQAVAARQGKASAWPYQPRQPGHFNEAEIDFPRRFN